MINGAQYVRREVMIRLVRAFDRNILADELDRIPVKMRPRGGQASRCCIYHDRMVLKHRLLSLLGFACRDEFDEVRPLEHFYREALNRSGEEENPPPLSVCAAGCSGCPPAQVMVTGNCRGCFARPCQYGCPKDAVKIINHVSVIDQGKCVKCGKCISACPFHAIIKTSVPCEEACPVNAIRKDEGGIAQIDFDRCIFCGKCFNDCPFGAIMERSQLFEVLRALKNGVEMVATVAPSVAGQLPGSLEQIYAGIKKIGFTEVLEVASGAELTIRHETEELLEKLAREPKALMTSSCCPAYVEFVKKHLPALAPHVSRTPSPMRFAQALAKSANPGARVVFIGPCIAKRLEAQIYGIDYCLSFEEVGAVLAARQLDILSIEREAMDHPASSEARGFADSGGVADAIQTEMNRRGDAAVVFKRTKINGITKKSIALLKMAAAGKLPENFIEVMSCEGGCVNGPCSLKK